MNWYQVKVRLERVQESGAVNKVTEQYLVRADTFGMAELAVQKAIAPAASGEFDITAVSRKSYADIVGEMGSEYGKWHRCKVNKIGINNNGDTKRFATNYYLVNADSLTAASERMSSHMDGSLVDYEIEKIEETKILMVFEAFKK